MSIQLTRLTAVASENLLGLQLLERIPAGLSLLYSGGLIVLLGLIFWTLLGRPQHRYGFEVGIAAEIKRRLSVSVTNRSLMIWRATFVMLALAVFGFHVYWGYYADENNENFQAHAYKDRRQRRADTYSLRGWILDRTGSLSNALAFYKVGKDGLLERTYSLESEMAHLLGSERGAPGLERTLFSRKEDYLPESWEVIWAKSRKDDGDRDVRLTIDRRLQDFIASELKGKRGAVVVINPQSGELLAMNSSPTFDVSESRSIEKWLDLEADKRDNPLLNRATREYYVPGSTFKLFTMIAAFRAGKQNELFESVEGGFVPFNGSRAIMDAVPPCEPPYGCGKLNMAQAFEASSNQYFAQMAVSLGRERLKETAKLFGIAAYDKPEETRRISLVEDVWNASEDGIRNGLAVQQSAIVMGGGISPYDLALQGMGQGYAGQMTPFQMALIASAVGNLEGKLIKPRIEFNVNPEPYSQVLTARQAARVREIMALVTEGPGGTATRAFLPVRAAGIRSGGKTGTAEKTAPVFDVVTGKIKTETKRRRNSSGEWVDYEVPVMYERVDSWYISIAPLERPTLAIAVVVEGGGYGARVAAPMAARIILKARELGLLGEVVGSRGEKSKEEAR